jgi:hypothetical protein
MNGEDNDCQPGLALSAKSCASFQLLPQQHSDFPRSGFGRRAACWLPIAVRAPRLELPALRSLSFHFTLYEQLRDAVCVITRKKGGARLLAPSLAGKLYPFP